MAEYFEERTTTDDRSFFNPFAIIIALLLLAALAWWIFAGPGTTPNNTQPTNVTPVPTDSATPSGTIP